MRAIVFDRIWRTNRWHGPETPAGPGSTTAATRYLAEWLPAVMDVIGATSVVDAGCNTAGWVPDLPGYIGIDIVPAAIDAARAVHPDRDYRVADIVSDDLPPSDVVMTRDVMQHLPLRDGLSVIANARRSGAAWLIASTHADGTNRNIPPGRWYSINLETPPFDMGPPILDTDDGFWDTGVVWPTKRFGLWPL